MTIKKAKLIVANKKSLVKLKEIEFIGILVVGHLLND